LKKILVTTGIFPPDIGGPATFIPKFSNFLTNHRFQVEVITLSDQLDTGELGYSFNVTRIRRKAFRWKRLVSTTILIWKRTRTADFVFCNGLYLETAIALALNSKTIRSLVKIVGDPVWEREQNRKTSNATKSFKMFILRLLQTNSLERRLITWSLRQFSRVTAPGKELAKTVESWDKSIQVEVIHNGVLARNIDREVEKKFDLVTVARLVPWKNIDIIIEIANQLDCKLAIIGDGPQRKSLESKASQNNKIVFLGSLTPIEAEEIMNKSKVFCQLSDYEGLSFSLLQAMSRGLPCVISGIPANKDVFDSDMEAGIFVDINDKPEIAKVISGLLKSQDRSRELGMRSHQIVKEHFDETRQMEKMMKLLIYGN
jgi:glycosyltransferase involved in cell wall biosynthesis